MNNKIRRREEKAAARRDREAQYGLKAGELEPRKLPVIARASFTSYRQLHGFERAMARGKPGRKPGFASSAVALAIAVLAAILLFPARALAQLADAPIDAVPAGVDPFANFDAGAVAKALMVAIEQGNWWIVVGTGLTLVVWAFRIFGARVHPRVGELLKNDVVAFALPPLFSSLAGVSTSLVAGMPIGTALISDVVKVWGAAVLQYLLIKTVTERREAAKAAGAEAAAAITTKAQAIEQLK